VRGEPAVQSIAPVAAARLLIVEPGAHIFGHRYAKPASRTGAARNRYFGPRSRPECCREKADERLRRP
jgi:hypothetical protein